MVVRNQPKKGSLLYAFYEAVAYFRWVNAALADAAKPYLLVNMDEASLTFAPQR